MPARDYYLGALFFAVTYGSVFVAVELAVRRRLPRYTGALRVVAWGVLATAGLIAVHLVPAALTILSRETAAACAIALLAIVAVVVRPGDGPPGPPAPARGERLQRLIAAVGIAGAAIWLLAALLNYLETPPIGFDVASAYLPTAARWLQEGSIWEIADWVPNAFYGSGPGNGSVIVLSAMLPWGNDFLAHLAIYPFVALFATTLYALGRELGAPSPLAALIGLMVTAAPVVVQPGLVDGLLDPVMYTSLAAGLLFLARHARTDSRSELLLAGIALGICFGTKFYGYTSVAVVLTVWVGARLLALVPLGTVLRQGAAVGGLVLAGGGIWMARNAIETGNPLLPLNVDPFGVTIFSAPADPQREVFGDTLASYFDQPEVWTDTLADQFRIAVGIPVLILGAAAIAAVAMLVRRWRLGPWEPASGVAAAALVAAFILAMAYAFTPYSAPGVGDSPNAAAINVRYGIPAMIAAVPVAAWLTGRIGARLQAVLAAVALFAVVDTLRVGTTTASSTVYASFIVAALGVGVAVLVGRSGWRPSVPRPGPAAAAALGVAVVAGLLLAGNRVQEGFNDDRYALVDEALTPVIATTDETDVGLSGHWSLAGTVPTYPSFGKRLQNRVEYVGRTDDGLLTAFSDRAAFLAALEDYGPDVLVLGRDVQTVFPEGQRPPPPATLRSWARQAGYSESARSDRFFVMVRA